MGIDYALYCQKEYTDFQIQMVIEDMNDMEVFLSEEPMVVRITGIIGYSPVIQNMPQNYNILNRLVPITFRKLVVGTGGFLPVSRSEKCGRGSFGGSDDI